MGKAIRAAAKDKIPVMCVIGQREAAEGSLAVRTYTSGDLGTMRSEDVLARLATATRDRSAF